MIVILHITLFLMISFWAYCNLFYEKKLLPYREGYLTFAVFQWIILAVNLIHFYGWIAGSIVTVILLAFGAIIITNFTTNQLYAMVFKGDPMVPLAIFASSVLINTALTIISFTT